tara:strand:- start:439 stop:1617 length:1179 start_codon:yes stop_codon:yes gene_type:complete
MNSLENLNLKGKKVLLRVDYNVPIQDNKITDTHRIDMTLDTINLILNKNIDKLFIVSHRGRPNGKYVKEMDLSLVHKYLSSVVREKILFIPGVISKGNIEYGEKIILFDNIRFNPEEESKTVNCDVISFRKYLTSLCDIYVNEAFGCCHRKHSSIVGVNAEIKSPGLLIESEIHYLQNLFQDKGDVLKTAIIGGSKVSDKIKLLNNIISKVNYLIIGGGMAFTFLKYFGHEIGKSLFDEDGYKLVPEIIKNAELHKTEIIFPIDFICNNKFENTGDVIYKDLKDGIPPNYMGLDIGSETVKKFKSVLFKSQRIIWNGPLGVFEFENFSNGSRQIMEYLANFSATTIIGGGDTAACCMKFNCHKKMNWVSTGGGASLTMIEGGKLPGIDFLYK